MEAVHCTTQGAATRLGVDRTTITRMVQSGELPAKEKLPGRTGAYLFDPAVIERVALEREIDRWAAS